MTTIRRLMQIVESAGQMSVPAVLYHVVPDTYHQGDDLISLHRQMGDDAYDEFERRWPESGGLGHYHAHYVMFYDSLEAARDHQKHFGGTILAVDSNELDGVRFDTLEQPGYWVTERPVPSDAITVVR